MPPRPAPAVRRVVTPLGVLWVARCKSGEWDVCRTPELALEFLASQGERLNPLWERVHPDWTPPPMTFERWLRAMVPVEDEELSA